MCFFLLSNLILVKLYSFKYKDAPFFNVQGRRTSSDVCVSTSTRVGVSTPQ